MSTNFHLNFNGWALIAVKVMRIFSDLYHGTYKGYALNDIGFKGLKNYQAQYL